MSETLMLRLEKGLHFLYPLICKELICEVCCSFYVKVLESGGTLRKIQSHFVHRDLIDFMHKNKTLKLLISNKKMKILILRLTF